MTPPLFHCDSQCTPRAVGHNQNLQFPDFSGPDFSVYKNQDFSGPVKTLHSSTVEIFSNDDAITGYYKVIHSQNKVITISFLRNPAGIHLVEKKGHWVGGSILQTFFVL